jgi:hypothetical protein
MTALDPWGSQQPASQFANVPTTIDETIENFETLGDDDHVAHNDKDADIDMDSVSQSLTLPLKRRAARNSLDVNVEDDDEEDELDSSTANITHDTIEQFPASLSQPTAASVRSKGKGRAIRSPTPPSPTRSSFRVAARRKASVLQRGMTAPLVLENN